MAVVIESELIAAFGELSADVAVVDISIEDAATGEIIAQKSLTSPRTLVAGQQAQFPADEVRFRFKRGAAMQGFRDAGLQKIYEAYFENNETRLRLYRQPASGDPVEITTTGYTPAVIRASRWVYSTEAD